MNERPTPETDANEHALTFFEHYGHESSLQDAPVDWADFARRLERERDEAMEDATNYYARIGELEHERDEARGAIQSTIAWLKERRKAHDFTTLRMIEERFLKVLEAAK